MTKRIAAQSLLLVSVLAVAGVAQDQPASEGALLPPEIEALTHDPASEPVDVFLIFGSQPARAASRSIRAAYTPRIDESLRPTREALARVEELLPSRTERRAMSVGEQAAAENALLRPDEREARRRANAEATSLRERMRREIMAAAWAQCAPVQQPLVDYVTALDGARVTAQTSVLNAVIVRVRPADLPGLLELFPEVAAVSLAEVRETSMDVSAPTLGADDWANNSVDGSNQKVGIVDTGVDGTHPGLKVSGNSIVIGSTVELENVKNNSAFNDNATSTDDLHGHGTHLAGTIAGQDSTYTGVAPGARLLNAKCFYRTTSGGGSGHDTDIVLATDWALNNGAGILNLSFGGGGTTNGTNGLTVFYDAIVDVTGASVAVAAGNSGPSSSTLGTPGDAFNAVTVGAQDDKNSTTVSGDTLASFSSRGPTADSRTKPDLCAPGVGITSYRNTWEGTTSDFVSKQGTSMATPHIAGAMALLLDHESNWEPAALKALLLNSTLNTTPVTNAPDSNWGFGIADLSQAYTDRDRVESGTFTTTGDSFVLYTLSNGASGDRATLCWNRVASFASGGQSAGGGTAKALVDLNLHLYDASTGTEHTSGTSGVNSVEQTSTSSAVTNAVLKVKRSGSFPSGQTDVDFAVASTADIDAADPPELVVTLADVDAVGPGGTVTVTATVRNDGDVPAIDPDVTLTLPSDWFFAVGQPEKITLVDLAADQARTATWAVVAPNAGGTATLSAAASTSSYGEQFDSADVEIDVTIDATPPTADAGEDVSGFATSPSGRAVTLDGSGTDASGAPVTFAWDTDADGSFDDASGATPAVTVPLGTHVLTLEVTDHVGNTATDSVSVEVLDNPPAADAGPDLSGVEGSPVFFDATGSTDIEGVLDHEWDFGDGSRAGGSRPAHVYGDNGLFTVTLTVVDLAGQRSTDSLVVDVENAPPAPDAGPDVVTAEGRTVDFSGTAADAGTGDVLTYRWTFGDGGAATGAAPSHRYMQDGSFTAVFTVTDEDGGIGADLVSVRVLNLPPTADGGADIFIDEGDTASLSGSGSDPGPVDTLTFSWDLGDGTVVDQASVVHRYVRDGPYRARLHVTDDAGATTSDEVLVTVRNVPPSLELPEVSHAPIGRSFRMHVDPTDPSPTDAARLRVEWSVIDDAAPGDGVIATGVGRDVEWRADRRISGAIEFQVFDDDTSVTRRMALVGTTPPVADALLPVFQLGLDHKIEKRIISALLAASQQAGENAKRGALRKAERAVRKAQKTLVKAGADDAVLAAVLQAISDDLAALEPPPGPDAFDEGTSLGTTAELIAALPGSGLTGKRLAKLQSSLFALHAAERRGLPEKKVAKLRRKALKLAQKLPQSPAADWYARSLLLL